MKVKGKNGTNDVYVIIKLDKEKFQTSVQERSKEPDWWEQCDFPLQGTHSLVKLKALHRNLVGRDDFLGQVEIDVSQFKVHERPKAKWYPLLNKPGSKSAEQYRGEIEAIVSFNVKSIASSQLTLNRSQKSTRAAASPAIKTLSAVRGFGDKLSGKAQTGDRNGSENIDAAARNARKRNSVILTMSYNKSEDSNEVVEQIKSTDDHVARSDFKEESNSKPDKKKSPSSSLVVPPSAKSLKNRFLTGRLRSQSTIDLSSLPSSRSFFGDLLERRVSTDTVTEEESDVATTSRTTDDDEVRTKERDFNHELDVTSHRLHESNSHQIESEKDADMKAMAIQSPQTNDFEEPHDVPSREAGLRLVSRKSISVDDGCSSTNGHLPVVIEESNSQLFIDYGRSTGLLQRQEGHSTEKQSSSSGGGGGPVTTDTDDDQFRENEVINDDTFCQRQQPSREARKTVLYDSIVDCLPVGGDAVLSCAGAQGQRKVETIMGQISQGPAVHEEFRVTTTDGERDFPEQRPQNTISAFESSMANNAVKSRQTNEIEANESEETGVVGGLEYSVESTSNLEAENGEQAVTKFYNSNTTTPQTVCAQVPTTASKLGPTSKTVPVNKVLPTQLVASVTAEYSAYSREDLIQLIIRQRIQLRERDAQVADMERYIDNLLAKVLDQQPMLLCSPGDRAPPQRPQASAIATVNIRSPTAQTTAPRATAIVSMTYSAATRQVSPFIRYAAPPRQQTRAPSGGRQLHFSSKPFLSLQKMLK